MAEGYSVTDERRARVARVRELRSRGMLQKEIAKEMGVSRNTVSDLLTDPWREKANLRRTKYGGQCERCGAQTDGSRGPAHGAPPLCTNCSRIVKHEERYWTSERILEAVARFFRETGRQPISQDWLYNDTRPEWAPYTSVVLREFGSWAKCMKAAGFVSYVGIKHRKRRSEMYHVLTEQADGSWKDIGVFTGNQQQAVNSAFAANPPENGTMPRIALVHSNSWVLKTVTPVEKVVYEFGAES